MCGIVGVLNLNKAMVSRVTIESMLNPINHRGPDERGIYINNHIGLGNVRLSIIDLISGQQPLSDVSGNYWIVFNGEIFNYIEIKDELVKKGYSFKTKSDTEVIVAGYSVWGKTVLSKLNGQFSFAIWDKKNQELFIARDRVGICPLFYYSKNGVFVFGSEIKAILQHNDIKPDISINPICQLFTYWSTLSPNTVFNDIYEVTPGHCITVSSKGIIDEVYWKLDYLDISNIKPLHFNEAKEELKDLLTDAVKIRLRADVPVAAYLSGGLDSTTTTALIKDIDPNVLNTFSIGFTNAVFDESDYQNEAAKYLGTNHKSILIGDHDISTIFPKIIWHTESPMLRTSPAPMYLLSNFVRNNNIKVVITGEGADEVFAGYDIFKEMAIRRFWAKIPNSKYRPLLLKKLYPYIPQIKGANALALKLFYGFKLQDTNLPYYSHLMRWNNGRHILKYLNPQYSKIVDDFDPFAAWLEKIPEGFDKWDNLAKAQYIESTLFMSGYLLSAQGDRMTMANSVEGRYPFLDHRVIEFANKLPEKFKLNGLNEKYILKKMIEGKIPSSINKRPKQAYRAPISSSFFNKENISFIDDLLNYKNIEGFGLFNPDLVLNLTNKIKRSDEVSEVENMIIMAIISAHLFYKNFILGDNSQFITRPNSKLLVIEEP